MKHFQSLIQLRNPLILVHFHTLSLLKHFVKNKKDFLLSKKSSFPNTIYLTPNESHSRNALLTAQAHFHPQVQPFLCYEGQPFVVPMY